MSGMSLDVASPARIAAGLAAVHIDIQRVTARLTFDAATRSGSGDATLRFVMGPLNGSPIFDLRQTLTAAWLDGMPVGVSQLGPGEPGGGPRVANCILAASSAHTLRVAYALDDALPDLAWSRGPRLVFSLAPTGSGPARCLEAWVPANSIFDQFEIVLELQVLNTPVAHRLASNGAVTELGFNHWSLAWPARSTALSPLVELRAADRVIRFDGRGTVSMDAWKLRAGPADLGAWLAQAEAGPRPTLRPCSCSPGP